MKKNIIIGIICGLLTGVVVACVLFFIFKKEEDEMAKDVATQMLNEIAEQAEKEVQLMEDAKAEETKNAEKAFEKMYGMTTEESATEIKEQLNLTYNLFEEKLGEYSIEELYELGAMPDAIAIVDERINSQFIIEHTQNENLYIWENFTLDTVIDVNSLKDCTVEVYYRNYKDTLEFSVLMNMGNGGFYFEQENNRWLVSGVDVKPFSFDGWELLYSLP